MVQKKTKIVCTIGPASWSYEMLKKLANAGMNVVRLNFSHGTHEEKKEQIQLVRKISKEIGKPLAVLADFQGPKLRLGEIEGIRKIDKGETVQLSMNPLTIELPMQYDLSPFVKPNQRIFLNDGLVELKVKSVKNKTIETVAQNNGWVSSHKGVNVPDTLLKGASFTEKDCQDAEFALKQNVDYVAISFVQSAEDLEPIKKLIKKIGAKAKIIVKVEKLEAIKNIEKIIAATDAVMVARGDLGIEIPASEVPVAQHKIVRLARRYQKPVIVATQMLESMTENPRPTRAEVSDVARAVMDQVDAVMLSAETASGKYPVEAVSIMKQIILDVERDPEYKHYIKIDWEMIEEKELMVNAIVASAASLAHRIRPKVIVVPTASGKTARFISSFRPDAQIVAVTHDIQMSNQTSLFWGVRTVITNPSGNFDTFLKNALEEVKKNDFVQKGDKVIFVTGSAVGISGSTDTIKVVTID